MPFERFSVLRVCDSTMTRSVHGKGNAGVASGLCPSTGLPQGCDRYNCDFIDACITEILRLNIEYKLDVVLSSRMTFTSMCNDGLLCNNQYLYEVAMGIRKWRLVTKTMKNYIVREFFYSIVFCFVVMITSDSTSDNKGCHHYNSRFSVLSYV